VLLELRREAVPFRDVGRADRRGVALLTAAMLLPLVPMLVRTAGLAIAGKNFYAGRGASGGLVHKTVLQAKSMPDAVGTKLILLLFVLAVVAVVVAWARAGVDWIAVGLLGAGFGTVLFAAKAGVVTSRYYIPAAAVAAIVLARSASRLGRNATAVAATALLALALVQAHKGHTAVSRWVDAERQQEQVVRQAAMRSAGGCRVAVTGSNAELVAALPVLVPLARERPGGCEPGERFVVVIDGGGERVSTAAGDAVIRGCEPSVEVARVHTLARILRCSSA